MRKTLKLLTSLIALVVVISSFCVITASAANSVSYTASPVIGATGDTVKINVSISSKVPLLFSNVVLTYNPSELEFVSSTKGNAVSDGNLTSTGSSVKYSGSFSKQSGAVFTVEFKVLKTSGVSALNLSSTENTDTDGNILTCSISNGSVTIVNVKPVDKISINKTSITLKKGETSKITATVSPSDATDKSVLYLSSNEKVATVSSNGTITAVGGGTATITVTSGEKSATCKVVVNVQQTGIKASGNTARSTVVGENLKLSVEKVPADASDNFTTTWSTSNASIATVSANGTVTAVTPGVVTITAKTNDWTVVYTVTVTEKTDESTTDESSTEESTDEESSSEEETTATPIFPTFEVTTSEKYSLVQPIIQNTQSDDDSQNPETRIYIMMIATAIVVAVVAVVVTFLVTKGYFGTKKKITEKKLNIVVEEKYRGK